MSSGTSPQAKKKGFTMPHTFVILVVIILIATALTWVIPSGEYARIEDPISGRKIVDATSFTYVDNVRVSPIQLPMLIINAFSANADLITLILLSGAAIHMLTATGALQALVASIVRRFSGKVSVFIPLLMLVFALICTTQGVNTFIAFAPITVMLALSLGLDSIVGVGILGGFDANKICAEFMNGAKKMLSAAFIIMFARAIGSVLSAGVITDTIVHSMAVVLTGLPAALLGVGMLAANTLINVVLTSGSGQAAAVMPIMIPLSDLLGVTRQTCILSFNFGDGFCNYILPTSTALMGILGAADVPYDRWMRFMWKIFLVWLAVGAVLVVIAQMINYGPM